MNNPKLLAHIDQIEHEVLTYMDLLMKCTLDEQQFLPETKSVKSNNDKEKIN